MFHNFMNKSYFDKNINNFNKINYESVLKSNKIIYKTDYSKSNFNDIDLDKLIKLTSDIKNEEKIECNYDDLLKTVLQKYKLCQNIKKKETNDIAIQCNINLGEDYEIVECSDIPRSSFLAVGNYLYDKCKNN